MTSPPSLAVSLAPSPLRRIAGGREIGHLHQYRCVESWRAAGFDVFSVNAADEADAVRAAYPDVPVVVAERDMRALCGRPLIPVSEMIRALRTAGADRAGIATADVQVADPAFVRRLADASRAAVFLDRAGVAHPCDGAGLFDPGGPSAVLFEVGNAATLDLDPFTLGLPGWGRALAVALLLDGAQAVYPSSAILLHLDHPGSCDDDLHRRFFEVFRSRFSSELEALRRTDHADLPSLDAVADLGRHASRYATLAAHRGGVIEFEGSARRHRTAYAAAVADLIRELSTPFLRDERLGGSEEIST